MRLFRELLEHEAVLVAEALRGVIGRDRAPLAAASPHRVVRRTEGGHHLTGRRALRKPAAFGRARIQATAGSGAEKRNIITIIRLQNCLNIQPLLEDTKKTFQRPFPQILTVYHWQPRNKWSRLLLLP